MGFNTLPFVFVFLPLFLAAFYLVPARWRAGLLCLGSLVFYVIGVWQRPWCLAPLLGLAVLVYLLGLRMRPRESRGLLVLGLAGGWPGAILGQQCFRHKTQKQPFRTWFFISVALNVAALAGLYVVYTHLLSR